MAFSKKSTKSQAPAEHKSPVIDSIKREWDLRVSRLTNRDRDPNDYHKGVADKAFEHITLKSVPGAYWTLILEKDVIKLRYKEVTKDKVSEGELYLTKIIKNDKDASCWMLLDKTELEKERKAKNIHILNGELTEADLDRINYECLSPTYEPDKLIDTTSELVKAFKKQQQGLKHRP